VLSVEHVFPWWDQLESGRKSIPLTIIERDGIKVETGAYPAIDYLKAVDELYFNSDTF